MVVRIQERIQKAFPELQTIWDASLLRLANYCAQQGSQRKYIQKNAVVELYPYAKDIILKIATVRPTSRKKVPTLFLEKLQENKIIKEALAEKKINSIGIAAVKNPNETVTCAFVGYYFNIPEDIFAAIPQEPHDFSAQSLFDAFNKLHTFVIHSELKQSEELTATINKYKTLLQEDSGKINDFQKDLNEVTKDKGTFVILTLPQAEGSFQDFLNQCIGNCDFQNVLFTNIIELASDLVVDKDGKKYVFIIGNYAPLPVPPEENQIYRNPRARKDQKKITIEEFVETLKATILSEREKAGKPKVEFGEQNVVEKMQNIANSACNNKTVGVSRKVKDDLSSVVGPDHFLNISVTTYGLTEDNAKEYITSLFQADPSALKEEYGHYVVAATKAPHSAYEIYISLVLYK